MEEEEEAGDESGVVVEELGTVGVESEVEGKEQRDVGVMLAGPAFGEIEVREESGAIILQLLVLELIALMLLA